MYEATIQNKVSCHGVGLHSGSDIKMELLPAPEGTGIVFIRGDLGNVRILANADYLIPTHLSTSLGRGDVTIRTVEHLLAAISALDIHNIIIRLDGPEVPALDGSAAPFVSLLLEAGVIYQGKVKPCIEFLKPVVVSSMGKYIAIHPSPTFDISYKIHFDHPVVSTQNYFYRHNRETFIEEIAPARTFGFLKDIPLLQAQGHALGGSLENAIVIGEDDILNKDGLRFSDEFVRHKIVDLIGDISLLGMPIIGRIEAFCSGHMLHAALIREVLRDRKAWTTVYEAVPLSSSEANLPSLSPA